MPKRHNHTAVRSLADCEAFIFDMDGTLTKPQHDFDDIRQQLDIPPGALILEHLAALPPQEQAAKQAALDAIEADIAARSIAAPGLFELLDTLRDQQTGFALLTRNSAANARVSLQAIGALNYFPAPLIIGRDEAPPKPDPAGINLLAQRLNTTPGQCAMVGDYRHDLEAGTRAGSHTVHIRHRETPAWEELTTTELSSLHQLHAALKPSQ